MANDFQVIKTQNHTLLKSMEGEFKKVLPNIITPERFTRVLLSALNNNTNLAQALNDPRSQTSVIKAFMKCAEMGLEPDGRRAAIVPYKSAKNGWDVQMIPMYQGLAEMAYRSGMISCIHADRICENDVFEYNMGKIVQHKPDFRNDRGKVYAYYAHVQFKDGMTVDQVMQRSEVEAIRDSSSGYQYAAKFGKDNPWINNFDEMGKKTVFRRLSKWLPLSSDIRSALEYDDDDYRSAPQSTPGQFDAFAQTVGVSPQPAPEDEAIDIEASSASKSGELFNEDEQR